MRRQKFDTLSLPLLELPPHLIENDDDLTMITMASQVFSWDGRSPSVGRTSPFMKKKPRKRYRQTTTDEHNHMDFPKVSEVSAHRRPTHEELFALGFIIAPLCRIANPHLNFLTGAYNRGSTPERERRQHRQRAIIVDVELVSIVNRLFITKKNRSDAAILARHNRFGRARLASYRQGEEVVRESVEHDHQARWIHIPRRPRSSCWNCADRARKRVHRSRMDSFFLPLKAAMVDLGA